MPKAARTRDVESFIRSLIASYEAVPRGGSFNTILWICDRDNELPAWFALDNPRIRSLTVARPDSLVRRLVAASLLRNVTGYNALDEAQRASTVEEFSSQTDGMTLNDLEAIATFCMLEGLGRAGHRRSRAPLQTRDH